MKHIDLTARLKKEFAPYKRTIGRYNSSELYGIVNGYLTPDEWISPKEPAVENMLKMMNGTVVHNFIQRILPVEGNEVKKVYTNPLFPEISLVAKVDHLPLEKVDNAIWELKTDEEELDKAKASHLFQVKLYCTVFERPKGYIYQPVQTKDSLFLKCVGEVDRDDAWFHRQFASLYAFHLQVMDLYKKVYEKK
jgi:hypothetical protein